MSGLAEEVSERTAEAISFLYGDSVGEAMGAHIALPAVRILADELIRRGSTMAAAMVADLVGDLEALVTIEV